MPRALPPALCPAPRRVRALLDRAPVGMSATAVESAAHWGIEFMAALPPALSALRELYGIAVFITAVLPLLRGGRFRVFMDNLGRVFILGGVAPPFAVGGKQWGEYVSRSPGGPWTRTCSCSPSACFRHSSTAISSSSLFGTPETRTCAQIFCHTPLSPASTTTGCSPIYTHGWTGAGARTPSPALLALPPATCQPLLAPFSGRFCSEYFHPAAVWTDAFSAPRADDNNWLFPPVPLIGRTPNHACASGGRGTLIVPLSPGCQWGPLLRPRGRWIPEISEALLLGTPDEHGMVCVASGSRGRGGRSRQHVRVDQLREGTFATAGRAGHSQSRRPRPTRLATAGGTFAPKVLDLLVKLRPASRGDVRPRVR